MNLLAGGRSVLFPRRPLIMGIVNLNDDSFSGDGTLDVSLALTNTRQLIAEGADIIDVGGESARTNRAAISIQEEIARMSSFLERFSEETLKAGPRDAAQIFPPLLSINTWRLEVAEALLQIGGDILNDMSGLPTLENARIAGAHQAALVIMHTVGEPKIARTHIHYEDVVQTQLDFFHEKIAGALTMGLSREQIILDPGIDFAKQREDNLTIYREFHRLAELGFPTLLPVSRKTVIGDVLGGVPASERDAGTVACIVAGAKRGAHIFRVHNVRAAWQTLKMLEALQQLHA